MIIIIFDEKRKLEEEVLWLGGGSSSRSAEAGVTVTPSCSHSASSQAKYASMGT